MSAESKHPGDWTEQRKLFRIALDVNNITISILEAFVSAESWQLVQGQIAAAHAAYREVTGEDSFDIALAKRRRRIYPEERKP